MTCLLFSPKIIVYNHWMLIFLKHTRFLVSMFIFTPNKKHRIKKYFSIVPPAKLSYALVMMFLLSFLTVANAFLFADNATNDTGISSSRSADDGGTNKRPVNPEEEKPTRSLSNTLTEEYIHHNDFFFGVYAARVPADYMHGHIYGLGDDHSTLDCPPPDHFFQG